MRYSFVRVTAWAIPMDDVAQRDSQRGGAMWTLHEAEAETARAWQAWQDVTRSIPPTGVRNENERERLHALARAYREAANRERVIRRARGA